MSSIESRCPEISLLETTTIVRILIYQMYYYSLHSCKLYASDKEKISHTMFFEIEVCLCVIRRAETRVNYITYQWESWLESIQISILSDSRIKKAEEQAVILSSFYCIFSLYYKRTEETKANN